MIFDGKITDKAQLDRIPGLNIKQRLTLLKALRSENKAGDRELDSGLNKLSGINADPSTIVVLDKNSAEFKRKQELKSRALAIQAEVTARGETITERQILNQIESEILAKKNTSEAKQALDSLNYYVIDKSGRAKPDRDWITGPVNRQTLPALKQKAGTDPKKLRQIQEIERLLKISEGG